MHNKISNTRNIFVNLREYTIMSNISCEFHLVIYVINKNIDNKLFWERQIFVTEKGNLNFYLKINNKKVSET